MELVFELGSPDQLNAIEYRRVDDTRMILIRPNTPLTHRHMDILNALAGVKSERGPRRQQRRGPRSSE